MSGRAHPAGLRQHGGTSSAEAYQFRYGRVCESAGAPGHSELWAGPQPDSCPSARFKSDNREENNAPACLPVASGFSRRTNGDEPKKPR